MTRFLPGIFIGMIFFVLGCKNQPRIQYTSLKIFKDFDSTRKFDTTSATSAMLYRPVKIDLFYPSTEQPATSPLAYSDLFNTYQQRMNYNNPMDSCKKATLELVSAIAGYLKIDSTKLLNYQTNIFSDLALPSEKFPLIVYASSMNGSSWENFALFDSLVHHGYIVAAISSVGKFPGYMTDAVDMNEQVEDILYAIEKLKKENYVDANKIGLLSWSLGGTANAKASMVSKDVKCMLSFDGTEIHYFGFDTSWDNEYKQIMQIPPYNPKDITAPYMYLSSEHPKDIDSIYLFPNYINSKDKYFVKFVDATHENFSVLPTIAKAIDSKFANMDSSRHEIICKLTVTFFNQYLKNSETLSSKDYIDELIATKPGFIHTDYPKK